MNAFTATSLLLLTVLAKASSAEHAGAGGPLNTEIAKTPLETSVSIVKTDRLMDGGSIVNDIRFADGRMYSLSIDFPFDVATDKIVHRDIHFSIYVPGRRKHREAVDHGSDSERRLIAGFERLSAKSTDPREKKNATTLARFLKNRRQGFPMGRKWWDFTPWSLEL